MAITIPQTASRSWARFYQVRTTKEPGWPMLVAMCAFVGSIPFETSFAVSQGAFSITTLIGYGFFLVAILNMRRAFATPPVAFWALAIYLYAMAITTVALSGSHMDDGVRRAVTLAQLLLMTLICSNLFRYPRFFFAALWSLGAAAFAVAALHAVGIGVVTAMAADGVRESQVGADPNFAAMTTGSGALALIGLAHGRRNAPWWQAVVIWPMAILMIYDLSKTGSRAGVVGLAFGLISFAVMKDSPVKMLMRSMAVVIALLGGFAVILQSPVMRARIDKTLNSGDTDGRELIFGGAVQMFKDRPLFGFGNINNQYELFSRISLSFKGNTLDHLDTHNQFLGVATESGLVGLVPFGLAMLMSFFYAFRGRGTQYGVIALGILFETVICNSSGNGHVLKLSWLAIAFAMGAHWAYEAEKAPATPLTVPVAA